MFKLIAMLCAAALVTACASTTSRVSAARSADPAKAAEIMRIVNDYMTEAHLKSVIVKVSADGQDLVTEPPANR